MKHHLRLIILTALPALIFMLGTALANVTLTSTEGQSIKAELLSTDGETVSIMMSGKRYTMPLDKLDEASQELIKKWKENGGNRTKRFRVEYKSGKSNVRSENEDYDDRKVELKPTLTIKNPSTTERSVDAKVTLIVLGKNVLERDLYQVMWVEEKNLISIGALGERKLEFTPIFFEYDDRGYAQYGSRYAGYIALIHDGKGEKYHLEAIPSGFENNTTFDLLNLKKDDMTDTKVRSE